MFAVGSGIDLFYSIERINDLLDRDLLVGTQDDGGIGRALCQRVGEHMPQVGSIKGLCAKVVGDRVVGDIYRPASPACRYYSPGG